MTIKDLITKLQTLPQDAQIVTYDPVCSEYDVAYGVDLVERADGATPVRGGVPGVQYYEIGDGR